MEHKEKLKYQTYIKRPVTVEAIQFKRENWQDILSFTEYKANNFVFNFENNLKHTCIIPTLEGDMIATEGDYIVKGIYGAYYICKEEIFNITYEKL